MENLNRGDKVRVIDPRFSNNPIVWNRDLYVAFKTEKFVHVTDNLKFPVFINNFETIQLKKIDEKEN